jgi:hypothetical protein
MTRATHIAVLICLCLLPAGCRAPEEKSPWDEIKIDDLAPQTGDGRPQNKKLQTINFDLHIYEVPADNIKEIDEIRRTLDTRPFRFNSQRAFSANSFSVYFGQLQTWNTVADLLITAGAERRSRTSLLLPDGQTEDITVAGFDYPLTIYFTSNRGTKEGARIGPGYLVMRIKAGSSPTLSDVTNITIYPVFLVPVGNAISQLDERIKLREFPFTAAAFGLNMSPGDFIFLSPEEYVTENSSLGGIFFNNPRGSLFFQKDKRKPPEFKPSFRVYMLTCTAIID